MKLIFFYLLAFITSILLTFLIRQYALAAQLIDVPNFRSSHEIPTPRGGGLSFVIVFILTSFFLYTQHFINFDALLVSTGGGLFIALLGFIDDRKNLSALVRFSGHFVAASFILIIIGGFPSLALGNWLIPAGLLLNLLGLFYLIWMVNLFNFMDGIDGLAASEAIFVCVSASLIYWLQGYYLALLLPLGLAVAVGGFLWWNFPPAKIFMGDAGSGFLGILIGIFTLSAGTIDSRFFWCWLILLGVFIVDATFTLLRRAFDKQRVWEAHCSHAYQYASRFYGNHRTVTIGILGINIIWLFPLAIACSLEKINGLSGLLIAYLPLIGLAFKFNAGKKPYLKEGTYSREV